MYLSEAEVKIVLDDEVNLPIDTISQTNFDGIVDLDGGTTANEEKASKTNAVGNGRFARVECVYRAGR